MREVAINVGLELLVGQLHVGSTQRRRRVPPVCSARAHYIWHPITVGLPVPR